MYRLKDLTDGINYYANGFTFKLVHEDDDWWSIYRLNEYSGQYMKQIQAKDIYRAKTWCNLCEPKVVPMERLC